MYNIERQEKILEILREKKSASVIELSKALSYSEATIRRDLTELSRDLKVRKTFGGAVIVEKYSSSIPSKVRSNENIAVKEKLAMQASKLIRDNMTLFLAESTTVEHLLPHLYKFNDLTVVTNSIEIPIRLASTNITVFSTGGKLLKNSSSFIGEYARKMIRQINADITFFSVRGLSENGKLTTSSTEDEIISTMIENSKKSCLLIDDSKFNNVYPYNLCSIKDIDTIVTNAKLPNGLTHDDIIITK